QQHWIMLPKRQDIPIEGAVTVYTDAGRKSRKGAVAWQKDGQWQYKILEGVQGDSLQTLELWAVVWTLQNWHQEPANIVSDSLDVVGVVRRIEEARIQEVQNHRLFELLL
ncbi:POK19 protein, partial [Bucco capensis]|nr:POK19 protein [Bucco capensis]